MAPDEVVAFQRRARFAYERGRLTNGLILASLALPLVALGAVLGASRDVLICFGGFVLVGAAVLKWWGRGLGRSVVPGLVAGVWPMLLVLALVACGFGCSGLGSTCGIAGAVAGLLSGVGLVRWAMRAAPESMVRSWLAAVCMAAATSCLTCAGVDVGVASGIALGLLAGGTALWVR